MVQHLSFIILCRDFLWKLRYKLKQGLFNNYLSGQLKIQSITTRTLNGGTDIATTVPVASVLFISENI